MIDLKAKSKVKEIGVSNFLENHLQDLISSSGVKPAINQFELHPLCYPKSLVEYCEKEQILVESYSSLARGDAKLI